MKADHEIQNQLKASALYHLRIANAAERHEVIEDVVQDAYIAWLEADRPNCVSKFGLRSAKNYVKKRDKYIRMEEKIMNGLTPNESFHLSPDDKIALYRIFFDARKRSGNRQKAASQRDVRILELVGQDFSNEEIGNIMDYPQAHIRKYRQWIRKVLRNSNTKYSGLVV